MNINNNAAHEASFAAQNNCLVCEIESNCVSKTESSAQSQSFHRVIHQFIDACVVVVAVVVATVFV